MKWPSAADPITMPRLSAEFFDGGNLTAGQRREVHQLIREHGFDLANCYVVAFENVTADGPLLRFELLASGEDGKPLWDESRKDFVLAPPQEVPLRSDLPTWWQPDTSSL